MNDQPTGQVWIENFDRGVITTLGAQILNWSMDGNSKPNYIIPLADITGLSSSDLAVDVNGTVAPGVPITFNNPSGVYEDYVLPSIDVSRNDEFSIALNRFVPCGLAYKAPATGASPETVTLPDGTEVNGYDNYETQQSAWPYDIVYTINIKAKYRRVARLILKKVLNIYQAYGSVSVLDSLGDTRTYDVFNEGFSDTSEVLSIDERMASWSMTIRVEAEIDINDPVEYKAVTSLPTHNMHHKE
jgi:hypothetical protein